MSKIAVLVEDWASLVDPVPYYSDDPGGCLDFGSVRAKPRSRLAALDETMMSDCEYGESYHVVICQVTDD